VKLSLFSKLSILNYNEFYYLYLFVLYIRMSEPKSRKKGGSSLSLAQYDQMLIHLQEQADCKKKQMRDDYKLLKQNVKENPYLQAAIDQYDEYFAVQKKQLAALQTLLKTIVSPSDQREIKKEISTLEKSLL